MCHLFPSETFSDTIWENTLWYLGHCLMVGREKKGKKRKEGREENLRFKTVEEKINKLGGRMERFTIFFNYIYIYFFPSTDFFFKNFLLRL